MALSDQIILNDIKKVLGLPQEYDVFDLDVVIHVNSCFSTLQQLGVGPDEAFIVLDGTETWDSFFGTTPNKQNLQAVKTYVFLRTRLLFDPPTSSFAVTAIKEQIRELEWRLEVQAEEGLVSGQP